MNGEECSASESLSPAGQLRDHSGDAKRDTIVTRAL